MIVNVPSWDTIHSAVSICYPDKKYGNKRLFFYEYWNLVKGWDGFLHGYIYLGQLCDWRDLMVSRTSRDKLETTLTKVIFNHYFWVLTYDLESSK